MQNECSVCRLPPVTSTQCTLFTYSTQPSVVLATDLLTTGQRREEKVLCTRVNARHFHVHTKREREKEELKIWKEKKRFVCRRIVGAEAILFQVKACVHLRCVGRRAHNFLNVWLLSSTSFFSSFSSRFVCNWCDAPSKSVANTMVKFSWHKNISSSFVCFCTFLDRFASFETTQCQLQLRL